MESHSLILGVTLYSLTLNLIAYGAFFIDKRRAQKRHRRISESKLLLMACLGGSLGAITAQHQFRHKTQKQPFKFWLYSIAVIQAALVIVMLIRRSL